MGKRRRAREALLKMLYEMDVAKLGLQEVKSVYWSHLDHIDESTVSGLEPEIMEFANMSFEGVAHNLSEIDRIVETHSTHWRIPRMNVVDRNILRMAVYELLYCQEIPPNVTINEAIELGKKFGTEDSGAFINGILDDIAKGLKKVDGDEIDKQR
ncbi:MAG: transcription antitermination factor NusB [Deltaproteobacteria bacterium]|nr:transcription antitermination factor NusB [Deltaproteobacteria bacterium]